MNMDNINMRSGNRYSVGSGQRLPVVSRSTASVPGAGSYESHLKHKSSAPNYGFGSGARSNLGRTANVPGPGNYAPHTFVGKEGNRNSIHAKLEYKPI